MILHDLMRRLERLSALDAPGKAVQSAIANALDPNPALKSALNGTWLGHPAHPMLTDIPIGAWTAACALDVVGGKRGRGAADRLVGLGVLAALPTAATGGANYADFNDARTRRVGLVHAAANDVAIVLFGASWLARKHGRRWKGRALSLAGMGAMTVGGYLGGHLSYGLGRGVDHTAWEERPEDWVDAVEESALPEGKLHAVDVQGTSVLLFKKAGRIAALANTCTHMGGPLDEGQLDDMCVVCPWHGSTFRLADGGIVRSPATMPQPRYDTRVLGGMVQVKEAR